MINLFISIDPQWIESLNTLMDDNKVLTLANNERIALKAEMRLLFEISHLRTATPGILIYYFIMFSYEKKSNFDVLF